MPTDAGTSSNDVLASQLQRMSSSVEEISARIARLAKTLDVDLQNENELNRVLSLDGGGGVPAQERRAAATAALPPGSPERRKAHLQQELRALLVMRYGIATHYVEEVGVTAARHILVNAQDQLEREGFKPGASGADLRRVFDGL